MVRLAHHKVFFVDPEYKNALSKAGLTSVEAVFSFDGGEEAGRNKTPGYRSRVKISVSEPAGTFYLKRYDKPGIITQIRNWFWHGSFKSTMFYDLEPSLQMAERGINVPKIVCYGEERGLVFERRSFIITEEVPGKSLEEKVPDCFHQPKTASNIRQRREFIIKLAQLARQFHNSGYRHRDFYLAHIFYSEKGEFYIIDLQRIFRPVLLAERFRIKDISQLYYSSPGSIFSRTDRLRFYKTYSGKNRLDSADKNFIRKVIRKVRRIARHDIKHGRAAPFAN